MSVFSFGLGLRPKGRFTRYFFGGALETSNGSVKNYYSFAGQTIAMKDSAGLQYFLTDHLGSITATLSDTGTLISQQRYLPFGAVRSIPNSPILSTDFGYTGQRKPDEGMGGIMDYKARFYSPYINRFLQPDTIIPSADNPQSWNRFSYVQNSPLNYTDPTGHMIVNDGGGCTTCDYTPSTPPTDPPGGGNPDDELEDDLKTGGGGNGGRGNNKGRNGEQGHNCRTITCRAISGDFGSIFDLIIPSHIGWRTQGEFGLTFGAEAGPGVTVTVGLNFVFNRKSKEFAMFVDGSLEPGAGIDPLVGGSATGGPIVGWGSSTVYDVAKGNSYIGSVTYSYSPYASSVAVTAPMEDDWKLHVDSVSGMVPVTLYGGGGVGTPYAGAGVGVSHSFGSAVIDLDSLLP